ncbi:MAG: hypothetical protein DRO93_14630, partial [Candidatus Thorarchaeota archaeon]
YPGDEMVLYREDGVKYPSEEDNLEEFLDSSKGGVGAIPLKPEKEDKEPVAEFLEKLPKDLNKTRA